MKRQEKKWSLLTILMVSMMSMGLSSCINDDDDEFGIYYEDISGSQMGNSINNNGHEYVDLGLNVYWATCNIGAYNPTNQGYKFAFGETSTKNEYTSANYVGGTEDVVKLNWGGDWRLPTKTEIEDLVSKCTWKMRTVDGVQVVTATGPNGNSIDLPYSSYIDIDGVLNGYLGWYWSSSSSSYSKAYCLHFSSADGTVSSGLNNKYLGFLVRGVITNPYYMESGDNTDNGNSGGNQNSTGSLYFTNFN